MSSCSTCGDKFTVPCGDCSGHGTIPCRCECGDIHGVRCTLCGGSGAFNCRECAPEAMKGRPLVLQADVVEPLR